MKTSGDDDKELYNGASVSLALTCVCGRITAGLQKHVSPFLIATRCVVEIDGVCVRHSRTLLRCIFRRKRGERANERLHFFILSCIMPFQRMYATSGKVQKRRSKDSKVFHTIYDRVYTYRRGRVGGQDS